MKIELGYGKGTQEIDVPDKNVMKVLAANDIKHERRGADAVVFALQNPIGAPLLRESVKPGRRVVIVTSDISRPLPSYDVLPAVLDELYAAGVSPDDITVVLALGSHRGHTEEEKCRLVGKRCYEEVKILDSDPDDCVNFGYTKQGTPVDISRVVAEADYRICLGNVEFHYFAGYSGGYKAIMPGCSTPAAIQANHRMMIREDAHAGKLDGNPIREDIDEAGAMVGVNYIVNAVLDEHKKIVYATAGDAAKAHRAACEYLDRMYRVSIPERADIVVVSQGGAPKDANLYQVQKALDNSKHAVKKGGTIILVGACNEGLGSKVFEEWITNAPTSHSLIERVHEKFELGGHKAAAIAQVMENAEICLVSEMDDDFVKSIFFTPKHSAAEALADAFKKHGSDASVIIMPFGGATLPVAD